MKQPRLDITLTPGGVYLFKVAKVTGQEDVHSGSVDPYERTAFCTCEDCMFRKRICKHIRRAAAVVSILMDRPLKKLRLGEDEENWL